MSGIFSAGGAGNVGASGSFYPVTIEDSLRFEDGSSAYLNRTPAAAGNRKTWTWSGWVKRGNIGTTGGIFQGYVSGSNLSRIGFSGITTDAIQVQNYISGSFNLVWETAAIFRDPSAWYHIVLAVDMTEASSSNAVKVFVNGTQQTLNFNAYTGSYSGQDTYVNATNVHNIGLGDSSDYLDSYLSDINFIDGQALDATSFGEAKDGVWIPKSYSGSYGTNGFRLEFDSDTTDSSGNGNDWTANNISAHDYVPDSPTNNFAVMNPLGFKPSNTTLSEGNLRVVTNTSSAFGSAATIAVDTGKWYWESIFAGGQYMIVGIDSAETPTSSDVYLGNTATSYSYYNANGQKINNATGTAYGATFGTNDIIGIALDLDVGTLTFYKNGVSQGIAFSGLSGLFTPAFSDVDTSSGGCNIVANFGQDSTFAGATTAGGNQDANGIGDFKYAPPSGYLALCTANLPTPTIVDGSEHFNTVLWTGNGTSQSITGVGFGSAPDLIWLKNRSGTDWHNLVDSVRGSSNRLSSNNALVEYTDATIISSIDADGFSVGSNSNGNRSGNAFVGWNWKAGGTAVSNAAGSITSQVSANVDAGFSIVSYTGTGANATVGHSLGVQPDMIIAKRRSGTDDWVCYHSALSSAKDKYIVLNSTNAAGTLSNFWGTGTPDSTTFGASGGYAHNKSGSTYIAYCFAEVAGYSSFGSYSGNGSSDGPMVFTGFRPSFILTKRSDGISLWGISDSKRSPFNEVANTLAANESYSESVLTSDMNVDFLSNGFKIRDTDGNYNASGGTYIFLAFASSPFKYATAR